MMARTPKTLEVTWYIERIDGIEYVVMTIGNRTRILEVLPKWKKTFAKRYLADNLMALKN